ncbi:MAG: hypothetical protein RBG13Loki_2726 [Promethearchaeota archaeon CR_4]|nr:MAG: hypothetical protein RBG13Loki_2726 [Candidatus Lokiarchaeota archaeon CR_4]
MVIKLPSFACKDIGMDCTWKANDKSQEGLMKKIADHAKKAHNMTSIDPALLEKVKGAIKK